MGNFITWLFTDPMSACASVAQATKTCVSVNTVNGTQYAEVFHFYIPWLIFCAVGLLIPLYYAVEGRRRLVKGRTLPVHKYMIDRFMKQLAWLAGVGLVLIAGRAYADATFFAWRFWRYGWALWGVGILVYWVVYLVRHYPEERDAWRNHQILSQYRPEPRARRKNVAKAGTR
jgi:hypothetical protein